MNVVKSLSLLAFLGTVCLCAGALRASETFITIDLSGGSQTVDVAADATNVVTAITPNIDANLTKTGAGLLVMTNANYATSYSNLVVQGGLVAIDAEACFGKSGVTLSGGGGLSVRAGFTQARTVVTIPSGGSGVLDIATGETLVLKNAYCSMTSATITQTGGGTVQTGDDLHTKIANVKWVVDNGILYSANPGAIPSTVTIEVHENSAFNCSRGVFTDTFGNVILRGGTWEEIGQSRTDSITDITIPSGAHGMVNLSGKITILPSSNGRPSLFRNLYFCTPTLGNMLTFDVQDGATLNLDCPFFIPAETYRKANAFRKTGGGTLRILKPFCTEGTFVHSEGTLVFANRNAKFDSNISYIPAEGAILRLEDRGAADETTIRLAPAVLRDAGIWVDASANPMTTGLSVDQFPNDGAVGGVFRRDPPAGNPSYLPNAINGLAVLNCGPVSPLAERGLSLRDTYSNYTENVTTFFVGRWDHWEQASNKGLDATPYSLAPATGKDSNAGGFRYEYKGTNTINVYFNGNSTALVVDDAMSASSGDPFINYTKRTATGGVFRQYWGAGAATSIEHTQSGQSWGNAKVNNAGLGVHLKSGGGYWGAGAYSQIQIGELLVFTRALTDDETAAVLAYLRNKWFAAGVTVPFPDPATPVEQTLDVPAGAQALYAPETEAGDGYVNLVKTGDGTLRYSGDVGAAGGLEIQAGTLSTETNASLCPAAVWIDASDSSSMSLAGGTVAAIANKGYAGGAFQPYDGDADKQPSLETINGLGALRFDGTNDVLRLASYTNPTPRECYVFLVKTRDAYKASAGAFSFASAAAAAADNNSDGALCVYDTAATTMAVDMGSIGTSHTTANTGATGLDYLFLIDRYGYGVELVSGSTPTNITKIPTASYTIDKKFSDADLAVTNDLFQIGGRLGAGGVPNNFWNGRIGELVVFDSLPTRSQILDLVAYLQKKWFGEGPGSATPPRFMTAGSSPAAGNHLLDLALGDGTSAIHGGATLDAADIAIGSGVKLSVAPFPATETVLYNFTGDQDGTFLFDNVEDTRAGLSYRHDSIVLYFNRGSIILIH